MDERNYMIINAAKTVIKGSCGYYKESALPALITLFSFLSRDKKFKNSAELIAKTMRSYEIVTDKEYDNILRAYPLTMDEMDYLVDMNSPGVVFRRE